MRVNPTRLPELTNADWDALTGRLSDDVGNPLNHAAKAATPCVRGYRNLTTISVENHTTVPASAVIRPHNHISNL